MAAEKDDAAHRAGRLVMDLVRKDLRPRRIVTRAAVENAIAGVAATGGSTNAVLHLLAIAHEAAVDLAIDDFERISERTPLLADLKPGGRFVATDLYRAGGIGARGEAPAGGRPAPRGLRDGDRREHRGSGAGGDRDRGPGGGAAGGRAADADGGGW